MGIPDTASRKAFLRSTEESRDTGIIKTICDLNDIPKQKFDAKGKKLKQSKKTNSKIREILTVHYIAFDFFFYLSLFTVKQTCKCI